MTEIEKQEFWQGLKELRASIDSLNKFDERLADRQQALAESLELLTRDMRELGHNMDRLTRNVEKDGENIRALARIAEIHERRITEN